MSAQIYVACLAGYNAGHRHGAWIDATSDADEMHEEIDAILASSPVAFEQLEATPEQRRRHPHRGNAQAVARFNARRAQRAGKPCPAHTTEEWAIHDTEGLPGIGEYISLEEIASLVELFEEHGADLVQALLAVEDREVAVQILEDGRVFAVDGSREDWAYDRMREELEGAGVSDATLDRVMGYFDAEKYLRDFNCGGGSFIEFGGELYVVS